MERPDVAVIGAGAVGTSIAYHLARESLNVVVIEKEVGPAMHQSGRNSGVIHAGYNPKPGTAKAEYCVRGNIMMKEFCADNDVAVREGGILIVAKTLEEISVLNELHSRGNRNGTKVVMLEADEIKEVEPHAKGVAALQAADGASVDSAGYVEAMARNATDLGAEFLYNHRVQSINESNKDVTVKTDKGSLEAGVVVNVAGLHADELAADLARDLMVIPFRGFYAELGADKTHLVNSHIYAAPDLSFPFLGIHLSKRFDGRQVIAGPGAMLAFGREAYTFASCDGGGLKEMLSYPGLYKMFTTEPKFMKLIPKELLKSLSTRAIGREAVQLASGISPRDFQKYSKAGNRAQLVDRHGNLVDDILVRDTERTIHVLNAVSPGLTCSLPFGRDVARQAIAKL